MTRQIILMQAVSLANVVTFSETAPADSDLDGVPDDVEAMLGEDNTSSTFPRLDSIHLAQ